MAFAKRSDRRLKLLAVLLVSLAYLLATAEAKALDAIWDCVNGWQMREDGNHYQCGDSGSGGTQTPRGGADGSSGGSGFENDGSGQWVQQGMPLSTDELLALRLRVPAKGWRPNDRPGTISATEQVLMFSFRDFGPEQFLIVNAWYRDAYERQMRTYPLRAGARTISCRIRSGLAENDAIVVSCGSRKLLSAVCFDSREVTRVNPGIAQIVSDGGCVNEKTYVPIGIPEHGVAEIRDGKVAYTADVGYEGEDVVRMGGVGEDGSISAFDVHVRVNAAPSCVLDGGQTVVERGQSSPVQVACSDSDGDSVRLARVDPPEHGSANGSAGSQSDGASITYVSDDTYLGDDQFTVRGVDSMGREAADLTTVRVQVVEPAPVCSGYRQDFDSALEASIPVSLACGLPGDIPLLEPLEYQLLSQPSRGTATGFDPGSGRFDYTPKSKTYRGIDSVNFTALYAGKQAYPATASLRSGRPTL